MQTGEQRKPNPLSTSTDPNSTSVKPTIIIPDRTYFADEANASTDAAQDDSPYPLCSLSPDAMTPDGPLSHLIHLDSQTSRVSPPPQALDDRPSMMVSPGVPYSNHPIVSEPVTPLPRRYQPSFVTHRASMPLPTAPPSSRALSVLDTHLHTLNANARRQQTAHFRFFDLAPEIRAIVYDFAFDQWTYKICRHGSRLTLRNVELPTQVGLPSWLKACTRIKDEGLAQLYQTKILSLEYLFLPSCGRSSPATLIRLENVRILEASWRKEIIIPKQGLPEVRCRPVDQESFRRIVRMMPRLLRYRASFIQEASAHPPCLQAYSNTKLVFPRVSTPALTMMDFIFRDELPNMGWLPFNKAVAEAIGGVCLGQDMDARTEIIVRVYSESVPHYSSANLSFQIHRVEVRKRDEGEEMVAQGEVGEYIEISVPVESWNDVEGKNQ
ncbi:Nn.00g062020.m01.CDS01 [Neocucurbitaria sp. VM-36]